MAQALRPALKVATRLAMTQDLRRSIALLAMGGRDLLAYVEQELQDNPLLERGSEDRSLRRSGSGAAPAPPRKAGSRHSQGPAAAPGGPLAGAAELPAGEDTLIEHLRRQIAIDIKTAGERGTAEGLLEHLDAAGYFVGDIAELARRWGKSQAAIESVLSKLQRLEPTGVFARNLAECLRLQLAERGELDEPMRRLLDRLDLLARHDHASLMRHCGLDATELARRIALIRRLDPKPGASFAREIVATAIPDLRVKPDDAGGWIVELNPELLPRLGIDRHYRRRIDPAEKTKEARSRFDAYLRQAHWLMRSLERRAQSLLALGEAILRHQEDFFREGPRGLQPLSRRDLARELGFHESSIGRLAAGKFLECPRGLYPLGFFFGPGLKDRSGGGAHAAGAVRARLKTLIAGEPSTKPLSDAELGRRLAAEGIAISRRTIVKYRELLKIPESRQRRRAKALPLAPAGLNHR